MLAAVGLALLLLVEGSWSRDSASGSVDRHTVSRIAAMLSPAECRRLRGWLAGPEEALERPSWDMSPSRPRRQPRGPLRCSAALRLWRDAEGAAVGWERLVRGLRRIGRADMALELGKNLNQDRSLELRRNVEGYGRAPRGLGPSLLLPGGQRSAARSRRAEGLRELRFERRPQPPYSRNLLGWVGPVVWGVLGGFLTSALLSLATACSCRFATAPAPPGPELGSARANESQSLAEALRTETDPACSGQGGGREGAGRGQGGSHPGSHPQLGSR